MARSFTFEVVYIAGSENVVADVLSQIYSNDSSGTVRTRSEHTYHDVVNNDTAEIQVTADLPVLAGIEARIATQQGSRLQLPSQKKAEMTASAPMAAAVASTAVKKPPKASST